MNVVETLIDKWAATRKEKALAELLDIAPTKLSAYKHGRLPMPAHHFLRLVELVDEPNKAELALEYLRAKAEKMSETFSWLLRRGMAVTSRGYVLV